MIHVAYRLWGGDGFFAKMLGTSMLSMFENTKEEVTIHVMHNDRLTPDNRGKLCYIAGQYNQHVEFHNVEEIAGATLRKFEAAYPSKSPINAAWYPLIVHEVFPNLDKLIFLGADTLFNLDIGELWAYDLEGSGYGIAAIPENLSHVPKFHPLIMDNLVSYEDYFNTDVMILKPEFFHQNLELILKGCEFIYKSKRYIEAEQDALSYLFGKKYLKLPGKFNQHVKFLPNHIEKAIYHFAGGESAKPSLDINHVFSKLYLEYFMKTPWANIDMFGNIGNFVHKLYSDSQNNMLHFVNLISERKRAFFMDQSYIEPMKQIFRIKDDEQIVTLQEGAEKFLQEITASKGEKIFFLLIGKENYHTSRMYLLSQGFIETVDFIDATIFLSERYASETDFIYLSRALVQAL